MKKNWDIMRFRSSQQSMDEGNAAVFFFHNNHSAKEMYNYICERVELVKKTENGECFKTRPKFTYISSR